MPPLTAQPQALCKTVANGSAPKGRIALALIRVPCSTGPSKGGRELPALGCSEMLSCSACPNWMGRLGLARNAYLSLCNPHFTFLLYFFWTESDLTAQAGLRALLEVRQCWRGRTLCLQIEVSVLLGPGFLWELSCIPRLLLVGSREQGTSGQCQRNTRICNLFLCLQTAEQGHKCLQISVGFWQNKGRLQQCQNTLLPV